MDKQEEQIKQEDVLVELTKRLIGFSTTKDNPEEVSKCMDFIKDFFSGCSVVIKEFRDNEKPSMIISFREAKKTKILFNGHIDVVEAEKQQFTPRIEDGRLFGRGSADMKAGVAAMMLLMKELSKKEPKPDVALMLVSDEEIGGLNGTGFLAENGYAGDFIIAAEPNHSLSADALDITIAHKGVLWIKIKALGKSCHGSRPWLGENAIEKLMAKYAEIKSLFDESTIKDNWRATINLGKISGGESPNIVPGKAEAILDIRFTEKESPEEILEKIKRVKGIDVEVLENAPMLNNSEGINELELLKDAIRDVTKKEPRLLKECGSSDLRFFSGKCKGAVICGPLGLGHHGKDEFVFVKSLGLYYKVLERFIELAG